MKAIVFAMLACFGLAAAIAAVLILYLIICGLIDYFREKNK